MEIRQIYYVLETAKYKNFSKAANALYISQPTISQQIHALEEELHTQLFSRSTHNVALTEEGEIFCKYAEEIIKNVDILMEIFNTNFEIGKPILKLGLFPFYKTMGLIPIINSYFSESGNISGSTKVVEKYEAYDMLRSGALDLAILKVQRNSFLPEFCYDILLEEKMNVLINRNHPLAGGDTFPFEALGQIPYLSGEKNSHYYREIKKKFDQQAVNFNIAFQNTLETDLIIEMVQSGKGVTFVSDLVGEAYSNDLICAIPLEPAEELLTCIVYSKSKKVPRHVKSFIEFLLKAYPSAAKEP